MTVRLITKEARDSSVCVTCQTCSNPDCKIYDWGGGDPCPECSPNAGQVTRRSAIKSGAEMAEGGWDCAVVALIGLGWIVVNAALVIDQLRV
jgi:hypothetical protein